MSILLVGVLVFSTVIAAGLLLMQPAFSAYVDTYAVRVRPRKVEPEFGVKPKSSTILSTCQIIGEIVLSVLPGLADKRTVELLTQCDHRTAAHLAILMGVKSIVATTAICTCLLGSTNNPMMLFLVPFTAVLGWLLPNFFLASRARKRQSQILRELPTIIDLLIVCAQAGLGLMLGVDKVSREVEDSCPTLCSEMQQLIQDVKIFAKSVPVAMRDMGERCGVDELVSMASALVAAEQKGADISYPLRQQGQALRERLKRKKEEEAAKVPVKMVPVIMIFIMPLILAPMLGPAIQTIYDTFIKIMPGQ
jgi:tight adherence protein C